MRSSFQGQHSPRAASGARNCTSSVCRVWCPLRSATQVQKCCPQTRDKSHSNHASFVHDRSRKKTSSSAFCNCLHLRRVHVTGGRVDNPTYEQVCSGRTGHTEAIELTYNPEEASGDSVMLRLRAYTCNLCSAGQAQHVCCDMCGIDAWCVVAMRRPTTSSSSRSSTRYTTPRPSTGRRAMQAPSIALASTTGATRRSRCDICKVVSPPSQPLLHARLRGHADRDCVVEMGTSLVFVAHRLRRQPKQRCQAQSLSWRS